MGSVPEVESQTYEAAHSALRVEFPLFYEGFDEPVAELRDMWSGQGS